MVRFILAGMTVIILALAAITGWLAYEQFSEDEGGAASTRPTAMPPAGWEAVPYKDKHDICYEFAYGSGEMLYRGSYQPCMDCGPDKVSYNKETRSWWCQH
jgi:hypothetical protein